MRVTRREALRVGASAALATELGLSPKLAEAQEQNEKPPFSVKPERERFGNKILTGINNEMLNAFFGGDRIMQTGYAQMLKSWNGVPNRILHFLIPSYIEADHYQKLSDFVKSLHLDYAVEFVRTEADSLPYTQDMAIPTTTKDGTTMLLVCGKDFTSLRFNQSRDLRAMKDTLGANSVLEVPVPIDGGNIIFTENHIFLGSNLILKSQKISDRSLPETEALAALRRHREIIVSFFEKFFKKEVVILGGDLEQSRFSFHLDIITLSVGKDEIIMTKTSEDDAETAIQQRLLEIRNKKVADLSFELDHLKRENMRLGETEPRSLAIRKVEGQIQKFSDLSALRDNFVDELRTVRAEIDTHLRFEAAQREKLIELGYTVSELPIGVTTLLKGSFPTNATLTTNPLTGRKECRFPVHEDLIHDIATVDYNPLSKSQLRGAALKMYELLEQKNIVPIPILHFSRQANGGVHCIQNVIE